MKNAAILGFLLSTQAYLLHASENNDVYPIHWEYYLKYIDPYVSPAQSPNPGADHASDPPILEHPPSPRAAGNKMQDIAQGIINRQRTVREKQRSTLDHLAKKLRSLPQLAPIPLANEKTITQPSFPSTQARDGYSARETHFDWDGKLAEYQYIDFEFIFDASDTRHIESMSQTISQLAQAGWTTDLNRSLPIAEKPRNNSGDLTITQMRFRRRR